MIMPHNLFLELFPLFLFTLYLPFSQRFEDPAFGQKDIPFCLILFKTVQLLERQVDFLSFGLNHEPGRGSNSFWITGEMKNFADFFKKS